MVSIERLQNNKIVYWSLMILLAFAFALSGYWEITKHPATYPKTIEMGYPPFFIFWLGVAKLIGAAALLVPQFKKIKEWAIAGFTFDVIFAFISNMTIASYSDNIRAVIAFVLLMVTQFLYFRKN